MVTGRRMERLVARAAELADVRPAAPAVTVWMPDNGRSGDGPGRYRLPGTIAVLVLYDPAVESPPEADV